MHFNIAREEKGTIIDSVFYAILIMDKLTVSLAKLVTIIQHFNCLALLPSSKSEYRSSLISDLKIHLNLLGVMHILTSLWMLNTPNAENRTANASY